MIFLFKKSTLIYFLIAFFIVVIDIIISLNIIFVIPQPTLRIILTLLITIFGFLFSSLLSNNIAKKEHDKLLNILLTDCNPERFVYKYRGIAMTRKKITKNTIVLKCNLATAYIKLGDYNHALEIYENIRNVASKRHFYDTVMSMNLYLCSTYCLLEEKELATEYYEKSKKIADRANPLNKKSQLFLKQFEITKNRYYFLMGNYSDCLVFFKQRMNIAKNNYERVETMFMQALIYQKFNDFENLKRCLEYVVENGYTMIEAEKACEMLEKLNS